MQQLNNISSFNNLLSGLNGYFKNERHIFIIKFYLNYNF